MIHWKNIDEFIEPNWDNASADVAVSLFWRVKTGGVFGYIRDGELFDHKWLYICDSDKVTHFSEVNGPESTVAAMDDCRPECTT